MRTSVLATLLDALRRNVARGAARRRAVRDRPGDRRPGAAAAAAPVPRRRRPGPTTATLQADPGRRVPRPAAAGRRRCCRRRRAAAAGGARAAPPTGRDAVGAGARRRRTRWALDARGHRGRARALAPGPLRQAGRWRTGRSSATPASCTPRSSPPSELPGAHRRRRARPRRRSLAATRAPVQAERSVDLPRSQRRRGPRRRRVRARRRRRGGPARGGRRRCWSRCGCSTSTAATRSARAASRWRSG